MKQMENKDHQGHSVLHKLYHEPGTAPGTLAKHSTAHLRTPKITLIKYTESDYSEQAFSSIEDCWGDNPLTGANQLTWINITGAHNPDLLKKLGDHYNIHPLSLEDVLNTGQRPKWETNTDYDFIILYLFAARKEISSRQVSIFLGSNYLLTLVESEHDGLDLVRERLHQGSGSIRRRGLDYLCYCVCDALIDGYSPLLENLGARLDDLEDKLVGDPKRTILSEIHYLKRELLVLANTIWAEREVINCMLRGDSLLIKQDNLRYLRDCYDHTVQYIDIIEVYRDMATSMVDAYLSSVSNQMNAVMKILTIIATIFIPLTFIVGIYGMNFKNMPELACPYGYQAVWGLMILIVIGMVIFFRRKGWF